MKKIIVLTGILILTAQMSFAETIVGEVLDVFCYVTKAAKGKEHSQCASKCIADGVPAAILTKEGEMFFPLRPDHKTANSLLEKYAGQQVKVTGEVKETNGTKFILLTNVEKAP